MLLVWVHVKWYGLQLQLSNSLMLMQCMECLSTTKYTHPIPLSRVQWSGVHVVKCERMCSSPCCLEAPQGQVNAVVELMLFSSLDVSVSDEVTSAVATCGRAMRQLRKLTITSINPLPLLRALGYRHCPLEHVTVKHPPWVSTILVCVDRTDDAML